MINTEAGYSAAGISTWHAWLKLNNDNVNNIEPRWSLLPRGSREQSDAQRREKQRWRRVTVIVHATWNCFEKRAVRDDTAGVYGRGTKSRIFSRHFHGRNRGGRCCRARDKSVRPVDLRLSSCTIGGARGVREPACAVDRSRRKTDFWTVDPRSIPEQVVFMSLFVRRIPVSTLENTIRSDGFSCAYTIRFVAKLLAYATRVPDAEGRSRPPISKSRGKKTGVRRLESVKRRISLGPPLPALWYFAFLPFSST